VSADRLREAARVLRERAGAIGAAPWCAREELAEVIPGQAGGSMYYRSSVYGFDSWQKGNTPYIASANSMTGAAYIATMHPGVGLALADWLNRLAASVEMDAPTDWNRREAHGRPEWATDGFAVADAILGGQS